MFAQIVQSSICLVVELLKNYGARSMCYLKPFFEEIEKLVLNSNTGTVKSECMNFYREAYKWMGEAVKCKIQNLKQQQKDELQKFFSEYQVQPIQPLRVDPELESKGAGTSGGGAGGNQCGGANIDPYDISDPVDIFGKFNEAWCDKVKAVAKWLEKKELLEQLIKAAAVPKLAASNFSPLLQLLKQLLSDNNINILQCAIKITIHLSGGLRKNFSGGAKLLSSLLFQKLKDKKQFIVDDSLKALSNIFLYCLSIEDVVDEFQSGFSDKNSVFKGNILTLLVRLFDERPKQIKNGLKVLLPHIKKLFDDGAPNVRDKSLQFVGKIKKEYGEQYLGNLLLDVPQQKLKKIEMHAAADQQNQLAIEEPSPINQPHQTISTPTNQSKANLNHAKGGGALQRNDSKKNLAATVDCSPKGAAPAKQQAAKQTMQEEIAAFYQSKLDTLDVHCSVDECA